MIADIKSSKVVFFIGAGASVAAGVPDTYSFVDEFKENIQEEDKKGTIEKIIETLKSWKNSNIDIELLLETLTKLENKEQEPLLQFYEDGNFILKDAFQKKPLIKDLKDFIKSKAIVSEENVQYLQPLLAFIHEFRPLDIVSLNYDTCIEQFCNIHKLTYQDGFDVYWNPKVFGAEHIDIRLYKLHGSVIWYQSDRGDYIKLPVMTDESKVQLITGEKAENLMLYPIQKWDYTEPLLELLVYAKQLLESETCEFLVVIGYSFRDDHIRRILWDAARKNRKLCVLLIDPNAHKIYSEKLKYYDNEQSNLSSLDGRVICLPYKFEKVFPSLRLYYLKKLQDALLDEEKQHKAEITGGKTDWMSSFNLFVEAEHFEKAENLLSKNDEIKHKLEGLDCLRKLEYLLKASLNFSEGKEEKEANEYFNKLNDFLRKMLIERIHVVATDRNGIEIHFNKHRNSLATNILSNECDNCIRAEGFNGYIENLNKICEMRKNFVCCNDGLFLKIVKKLKELKDYLEPIVRDISSRDYRELRKNNGLSDQFSDKYKKFREEGYSPKLRKELESMIQKVETGILEEIVKKK